MNGLDKVASEVAVPAGISADEQLAALTANLGEEIGSYQHPTGEGELVFRNGPHFYLVVASVNFEYDGERRTAAEVQQAHPEMDVSGYWRGLEVGRVRHACGFEPILAGDCEEWFLRHELPVPACVTEICELAHRPRGRKVARPDGLRELGCEIASARALMELLAQEIVRMSSAEGGFYVGTPADGLLTLATGQGQRLDSVFRECQAVRIE